MYANMEWWSEIRRRVLTGEMSKREACLEYEIHWKTLAKILRLPACSSRSRTPCRRTPRCLRPFQITELHSRAPHFWSARSSSRRCTLIRRQQAPPPERQLRLHTRAVPVRSLRPHARRLASTTTITTAPRPTWKRAASLPGDGRPAGGREEMTTRLTTAVVLLLGACPAAEAQRRVHLGRPGREDARKG